MKIRFTLISAFLMVASLVFGQHCEDSDRYVTPMQGTIERQQIDFATVRDYTNQNRILRAHIYTLAGDTVTNRPLIVLAHGGAFLFGSKNDMKSQCELMASLGYVCAAIDYRLYPILLGLPDSAKVVEIAFNAISDMRAAVRHFKADADRANTFRINPDNITVGGLSAGAIMALHVGILDENDPLTPEFETFLAARGGIEGNVGDSINQSYDSKVSAILNMSGALFSLDWLSEGDPLIMGMHGDADNTVPYGTAREGAFNRVTVSGSSDIHDKAVSLGLSSYFMGVPGGGHTDIYGGVFTPFYDEFKAESQRIMRDMVCEGSSQLDQLPLYIAMQVYPNPAAHDFIATFSEPISGTYSLIDMLGARQVYGKIDHANSVYFQKGSLSPGIYHLVIESNNGIRESRKICLY
jgi:para-nitrobenzyl esterase